MIITDLKDKCILISIPNDFELPEMFQENLEYWGLKVYNLSHALNFHGLTLNDKIIHNYRKIFKKDRTFKAKVPDRNRKRIEKKMHLQELESIIEKIDFALIIRPDLLDDEVINRIKSKSRKMIGYQWDGLQRYPEVIRKLPLFDHFLVFDKKDLLVNKKVILTTNFYFDYDLKINNKVENDVYFVGSHIESRMPILEKITNIFTNQNLKIDINVMGSPENYIHKNFNSSIKHLSKIIGFKENYQKIKNAKIVLDLLNNAHSGLSFRVFESIGLKRKLITDNKTILEYDFYTPENIFIIGHEKLEDLSSFLKYDYKELDAKTYEKYSFKNWLIRLLTD